MKFYLMATKPSITGPCVLIGSHWCVLGKNEEKIAFVTVVEGLWEEIKYVPSVHIFENYA